MIRHATTAALVSLALAAPVATANTVDIEEGQTNVALDLDTILAAANLLLVGVDGDVIAPGSFEGSVAFPINERGPKIGLGGDELPTTFSYDPLDLLGSFSGTIEHEGELTFFAIPLAAEVVVGDFTIGFDAARAGTLGGNASGFFVASTAGIEAPLFDVAAPSELFASRLEARIGADLLVSPEFAALSTWASRRRTCRAPMSATRSSRATPGARASTSTTTGRSTCAT